MALPEIKTHDAASALTHKEKSVSKKITQSNWFWGYLMIAPTMIGLLIFYLWPILQTIYFSFTTWGAFGNFSWVGIDNYTKLLHDPTTLKAFRNTLVFTVCTVPIGIFLSIFVAVLLNNKIKGLTVYRTLYFLPVVTMPAAIAMVWRWLYNGDYGLINQVLAAFHIQGPDWTTDPHIALISVIIVAIWSGIGYNMVIFLSGLQGIPSTYYEAAMIDGAGPLTRFFKVTLPLLSPVIFFVSIMSLIGALQVFDLILMMIGPTNNAIESSETLVYLFYHDAFALNEKGYGAAIAVILLIFILIVTAIQMRLQKKWVHYD